MVLKDLQVLTVWVMLHTPKLRHIRVVRVADGSQCHAGPDRDVQLGRGFVVVTSLLCVSAASRPLFVAVSATEVAEFTEKRDVAHFAQQTANAMHQRAWGRLAFPVRRETSADKRAPHVLHVCASEQMLRVQQLQRPNRTATPNAEPRPGRRLKAYRANSGRQPGHPCAERITVLAWFNRSPSSIRPWPSIDPGGISEWTLIRNITRVKNQHGRGNSEWTQSPTRYTSNQPDA